MDYMKLANSFGNEKEEVSSEEKDNDENDLDEAISKESPTKANIEEIKEEIVLYESLVENKMTSENVSNLVVLLKKVFFVIKYRRLSSTLRLGRWSFRFT